MKEAYIYKDEQIIVADIKEDKCVEVKYGYQDNCTGGCYCFKLCD